MRLRGASIGQSLTFADARLFGLVILQSKINKSFAILDASLGL